MAKTKPETNRRSANFPPGISSDIFLSYVSQDTNYKLDVHGKLKDEVNKMLMEGAVDKPWTKLDLIDAIQRLGVSYHFEEKIDEILGQIHATTWDDNNLYNNALQFRLLRQHGYHVTSDVFNKFKDDQGKLDESLASDVRGMLSLYEATHLRIHGEDILEEALVFTAKHLKSMAENLSPPLSTQVSHALSLPLRRNLPRLEARHYMSVYEDNSSHNQLLLTFAKLDFNMLQRQHQKELGELSRWWKDLDIMKKLAFARDRIAECYYWSLGVYFEPEYSPGRIILTKAIVITSLLDDIYDTYGTVEEVRLLTEAIDRWDMSAMKNLPEYMKVLYRELLQFYNHEIEETMIAQGKSYRAHYAKQAVQLLSRAYLDKAKWLHNNYVPSTMEEFMQVGLMTSTIPNLIVASLVGMGDIVNKDAFDWVLNVESKMVIASSTIGRLLNDITSHEFEEERGSAATSVECYMKQHGTSKQEAVDELYRKVDDEWKDINEECLRPFRFPLPILTRIINQARTCHVIYKDGDAYTFSQLLLKDQIASLLADPLPLAEM